MLHKAKIFIVAISLLLLCQLWCTNSQVNVGGIRPEDITIVNSNSNVAATTTTTSILIKNGIVVNADQSFKADVLIENDKIVRVSKTPIVIQQSDDHHHQNHHHHFPGVKVLDANGMYVMPGGIDTHVHMEMPFMGTVSKDDFETGTRAALAGGTTMIMDFPIMSADKGPLAIYEEYRQKAGERATCDYGFHIGITRFDSKVKREMEQLSRELGTINSYKFFMAYKGALMLNDEPLYEAMKVARSVGAISMIHAENGDMVHSKQRELVEQGITGPEGHALSRPSWVEAEAVHRVSVLAHQANAPVYIVHVTSKEAMEEVRRAKEKGYRIVGEPISAGLVLDESHYWDKDWLTAAKYVMSPPLRSKMDQRALINGLKSGILDLIGTDHCSFNLTQKKMGVDDFTRIPNGLPVVEHRMVTSFDRLVSSGEITVNDFVRVTSTEAAQIFNIYPRKGVIAEGSDADIVIFNPNATTTISAKTHHHNVDYSVYEGMVFNGKVETTISAGRIAFHDGKIVDAKKGSGRFVATPPHGKMFNGLDREIRSNTPTPVPRV